MTRKKKPHPTTTLAGTARERGGDDVDILINNLAQDALASGNQGEKAKTNLQELLGLDDLNFRYFYALLRKQKLPSKIKPLILTEPGTPPPSKKTAVFSTATAPKELLAELPLVHYDELIKPHHSYGEKSRNVTLWVKKMHAGTGSSMDRTSYLSEKLDIPAEHVRIGAKGTDLFIELPNDGKKRVRSTLPLAEVQVIQLMKRLGQNEFGGIIFHDIVGPDTSESVASLWNKKSYLHPKRTYAEVIRFTDNLSYSGKTFQALLPTLDENNLLTLKRQTPGGHALFGLEALLLALEDSTLPDTQGKTLVSVVSNGEDLSTTPDQYMVGWLQTEKIPIAMVTTDKTEIDAKGGQIGFIRSENKVFVTLIEQAQAKAVGQEILFEQLGLRTGDQAVYFNTNMALFNYDILVPRLQQMVSDMGQKKLMEVMAPHLILNPKEKKDGDGITRTYRQLEGAMGSSLLNLDRYSRERYGTPLVHFINVSREKRTEFFSPLKTPFDFLLQFHSDRFHFDTVRMRLVNLRPGCLPLISLESPQSHPSYYKDLKTVLDAFRDTSLKHLDELVISGAIILRRAALKKRVSIINDTDHIVDIGALLSKEGHSLELENVKVRVEGGDRLKVSTLH